MGRLGVVSFTRLSMKIKGNGDKKYGKDKKNIIDHYDGDYARVYRAGDPAR